MLCSLIGKLDNKYVSQLATRKREEIEKAYKNINSRIELSPITHHGGPCLMGVRRLFVRVDGALFPCERLSDVVDYFKIGTLEGGFDLRQIQKILNIGKITENECKSCWNSSHCSICAGYIDFEHEPSLVDKHENCVSNEEQALFKLHEYAVLNEFHLSAEKMENI